MALPTGIRDLREHEDDDDDKKLPLGPQTRSAHSKTTEYHNRMARQDTPFPIDENRKTVF